MGKVDICEIDAYSWDCPKFGHDNCHDKYADLICEGCSEEFEVGEVTTN